MSSKKIFFVMIGVVVLLAGAGIATLIFGNKILNNESVRLVELKLEDQLLNSQQTALVTANKDIATFADLEAIAKSIVPQDKDQARAVREIVSIADSSGIKLKTISFPSSTLGQAPVKPATPAPTVDDGSKKPAVATLPTPTPPAAPSITQVKPVDGIPGVYTMEITIQSDDTSPITYETFINFLSRLEKNRRTAQVSTISLQPKPPQNTLFTFSLVVNLYIRP